MVNHSKLHNPNYVGPGIWYKMHLDAAWADTDDKKRVVIEQIKYLQSNFPCGECKEHFENYIRTHPLELTLGKSPESLFLWTFNFHNAVNHRLKKPQVSYDDAKKIFYNNSEFCASDCTKEEKKSKTPPRLIPKDLPNYIL
jgi:hypothetical protein